MTVTTKQNGSELLVCVEGRLDTNTAPELEKVISPMLSKTETLIFDFSSLKYISSAGLRILIRAHRGLKMGGKTIVRNGNPIVREVFEVTGLTEFITVE